VSDLSFNRGGLRITKLACQITRDMVDVEYSLVDFWVYVDCQHRECAHTLCDLLGMPVAIIRRDAGTLHVRAK
jgi:hypothetical protein